VQVAGVPVKYSPKVVRKEMAYELNAPWDSIEMVENIQVDKARPYILPLGLAVRCAEAPAERAGHENMKLPVC